MGHFESSLGLLGCPTRGVMDIRIKAGGMFGDAHNGTVVIVVTGAVGDTGEIKDGVFRRGNSAAAIMTGTFAAGIAAGRWQGASCEGVWSLQRIS